MNEENQDKAVCQLKEYFRRTATYTEVMETMTRGCIAIMGDENPPNRDVTNTISMAMDILALIKPLVVEDARRTD